MKSLIASIFLPRGITGLLHAFSASIDFGDIAEDLRDIDVLGTLMSGSLNRTAVAGRDLGTRNPVFSMNSEAYTDITTAPVKPATNDDTSASTIEF